MQSVAQDIYHRITELADPGGCSLAGIAGLNPAGGMDVCLLWVLFVGR
jgi:hypothetical protein